MDLKKLGAEAAEKMGLKLGEGADKLGKVLAYPQKQASKAVAESVGLKDAGSSEANFAAMADKAGDAMGVPRDSTLGNAAKASAVAAAELFGDPLNVIPIGKLAKVAGASLKGLKMLPALGTIVETGQKLKKEAGAAISAETLRAKKLEEVANKLKHQEFLKSKDMQMITAESSRNTPTYQKLDVARIEQNAEPTLKVRPDPAPKGKVQLQNEATEAGKALDAALAQGVPPERQSTFVKLWLRARGIK